MPDLIEIEDSELDRIAEERRHKKLIASIGRLIEVMKKDTSGDNKISELVATNNTAISKFINKLNEISTPNINIEKGEQVIQNLDISPLSEAIQSVIKGQTEIIELLKTKPTKMVINRNNNPYGDNAIKEIEIKYEKINK